jgi:SHAQKYF class myb-like DNA-binding protein
MSFGNPNIGQQDNDASQLMAAAGLHGKSSEDINSHGGRWTQEEHKKFIKGLKIFGKDWI